MEDMKQTILKFIERINAHDVDGIMGLVSDDYEYINSSGDHFRDRQFIRDTWRAQFENHPDYKVRINRVIADGEAVGVFGWAEGTYAPDGVLRDDNHWEVPCAFQLIARDGKVTYFESYSDASIVFDLIKSRNAAQPVEGDSGE